MGRRIARLKKYMDEIFPMRKFRRHLPAIDELILTILSQNTSDTNSFAAYESLRKRFPTWEKVASANVRSIASAIRKGGLADQKGPRIKSILKEIHKSTGAYDLEHLREMPMDEAMQYLLHFNGVGMKTAGCVLLFSLGKPAFPVDTHILRVSQRLGIIGPKVNADKASAVYMEYTSPGDRLKFHIDIIHFGRQVCHARNPECDKCKLTRMCFYYGDVVKQSH